MKRTRTFAHALTCGLLAMLLAAMSVGGASATAAGYDGVSNFAITDTPTTLTLFEAFGTAGAPTGDMPIWQEAAKMTGISMQNVANPSITDPKESLSTMLATGKLPDIIYGGKDDLGTVVQQGGFIPLNDLIAQYAPNIQKYFEVNPDAQVSSTYSDGQKYYIAGTLTPTIGTTKSALVPTMMFFIRTDWLKKLNLAVPTNMTELETVLYAFRNDDPNGNGQKDEIPFFYRDGSPVGLYQLFGVPGNWANWGIDTATNTVVFGRLTDAYKDALRTMSKWYKDGIIDPEILTRGSQARQELLGNNVGGMTYDWYESTSNMNYNTDITDAVPGFEFMPIMPPADANGVVKNIDSQAPIDGNVWGISKDCKDPVAAIKYMDFWFSQPGSMLMTYGIEGTSYTMVDGQPAYSEAATSFGSGIPNYMLSIGSGGVHGLVAVDLSTKTEIAQEAYHMYADSDILQPPFPTLTFNDDEAKIIADDWPAIDTLWAQYEQQVLYGEKDVDASWAGYLAEMDSLGMSDLLAAYNSAYARYCAQLGQ